MHIFAKSCFKSKLIFLNFHFKNFITADFNIPVSFSAYMDLAIRNYIQQAIYFSRRKLSLICRHPEAAVSLKYNFYVCKAQSFIFIQWKIQRICYIVCIVDRWSKYESIQRKVKPWRETFMNSNGIAAIIISLSLLLFLECSEYSEYILKFVYFCYYLVRKGK